MPWPHPPDHPRLLRRVGSPSCSDSRPKHIWGQIALCAKIVRLHRKWRPGAEQTPRRRLTETCWVEICKIGTKMTSSVRFPVVLNEWHLQPAYLDTTTGHPSTSFTTAVLLLSCLEELYTTVDKAVELGVWKVIKLIAWGRMSSCNVPSPDTSSLSLTASSFIIFFWSHLGLNCLSPLPRHFFKSVS